MDYNIIENSQNDNSIELNPTFEVYLNGEVVFFAPTKTECEEWISQQ
jgi:hypothetical protein